MACACKVSKYLNRVEQRYGTNIRPTKKTDISGKIKTFFKKALIWIVCLSFIPIVLRQTSKDSVFIISLNSSNL